MADSKFWIGLLSDLGPRSNVPGAFWPFLTASQATEPVLHEREDVTHQCWAGNRDLVKDGQVIS